MTTFLNKHKLLAFFLLTFSITWGIPGVGMLLGLDVNLSEYSLLTYIVIWAPPIAAFTIIALTQGWDGVRGYLRRLLHCRVSWVWYVAVLVGVPLMNYVAGLLMGVVVEPWLITPQIALQTFVIIVLLRGTQGPLEEFGWRGFALPLMQRKWSGLTSAIILGFIWMLWHVPGLFVESIMTGAIEGNALIMLVRLFAGGIATSVVMTVIYNGSGGSIPLMILYHWLTNVPYPWEPGSGINMMQDVLGVAVALVLVLTVGRRYLGKENLFTDVTPGGV